VDRELERWETRFSGDHYLFGTEPNVFLKSHAHRFKKGDRILSVADGEGRNSVWLAGQGFDVHAIEFSPKALAKARKLAADRGVTVTFEQADLRDWAWPTDAYDGIAAIFIQFAPPEFRQRIFQGMRQATKPGGLVLIQGYSPKQLEFKSGGPSQIEHLYTTEMMRAAFGDWEIVSLREHESELREGNHHVGMSGLVDLVARKPKT
jgi:cyclopropane fatty-acyl-phospholipid synthase-like methyltransferase